jgi:hypothetical protein
MSEKMRALASLWERVVKVIQGYEGFGFFYNFFSNLSMIKRLLQKKHFACSTIRDKLFHMLNFVQRSQNARVNLLRRETSEMLNGKTTGRNFLIQFRHYYRLKVLPKGFPDLFDNSTNCRPTHAVGESQ